MSDDPSHIAEVLVLLGIFSIITSLIVVAEVLLFHSVKKSQIKRMTATLMLTNIMLSIMLVAEAALNIDNRTDSQTLTQACFVNSLEDAILLLNIAFEVFLLVCCTYSLFERATALPLRWELLGHLVCLLVLVVVFAVLFRSCTNSCTDAIDVFNHAKAACSTIWSDTNIITLGFVGVVVIMWIFIHAKIRALRAHWTSVEQSDESDGSMTKIERINRRRLVQIEKDAFEAGYKPFAWFQGIFVFFCIGQALWVAGREDDSLDTINAGSSVHAVRTILQAFSYFSSQELRDHLRPSTVCKRISRLRRRRLQSKERRLQGQPLSVIVVDGEVDIGEDNSSSDHDDDNDEQGIGNANINHGHDESDRGSAKNYSDSTDNNSEIQSCDTVSSTGFHKHNDNTQSAVPPDSCDFSNTLIKAAPSAAPGILRSTTKKSSKNNIRQSRRSSKPVLRFSSDLQVSLLPQEKKHGNNDDSFSSETD